MLAIHIIFVLSSFISFVGRVILSELKPELLSSKVFKIAPHLIDTALLLSGIGLIIHGNWIASGNYGWIITKFMALIVYIALGALAMRCSGTQRWLAFAGAMICYGYIFSVAITKHGLF